MAQTFEGNLMEAISHSPSGVYPRLLGDSWYTLNDAIRRLHGSGATVHTVGVFQVRHGSNPLVRMLIWLMQLPAEGEAVDVQLLVTARKDGEEWRRTFAGRPLLSMQSSRSDGLLVERMGIVEIRFRLEVVVGALGYQTSSVALCLGFWRVPLPHWLRPQVVAWERPAGGRVQIYASVDVSFPWLGRLIAYEGKLAEVEVLG